MMKVKLFRSIFLFFLAIFLITVSGLYGCQFFGDRVTLRVLDIPTGISDISTGKIISFPQVEDLKGNKQRVDFLSNPNSNREENDKENSNSSYPKIVISSFKEEIRLIDFYLPGRNEDPVFSFKNTAKSLILMNPVFAGLPPKKLYLVLDRIEGIEKNNSGETDLSNQYQALVNRIEVADSLLDDEVIDLASGIALGISLTLGETEQGSSNLGHPISLKNIFEWIFPSAHAQESGGSSGLDYSITKQFNSDGLLNDWPQWHGLELQADTSGIRVTGTSPIAQQIIVLPTDKVQYPISPNDYGWWGRNKEQDIAGELLIYPAPINLWEGDAWSTITGGNEVQETLKPTSGGEWPSGLYTVMLSGATVFNRWTDTQKFGAFQLNMAMLYKDLMALLLGQSDLSVLEVAELSSEIALSCGVEYIQGTPTLTGEISLETQDTQDIVNALSKVLECYSNPENLIKIVSLIGIDIEEETSDYVMGANLENIGNVFRIYGHLWAANIANSLKEAWKRKDVPARALSTSRVGVLGLYLDSHNKARDAYKAEFRVIDPSQFQTSPMDCSSRPVGSFYDLEVTKCINSTSIKAKNYSNDWYEVQRFYAQPEERNSIFNRIRGHYRTGRPRINGLLSTIIGPNREIELRVNTENPQLDIRRFNGPPSRDISISCDDSPQEIWDIEIFPKCNTDGTFVEFKSYSNPHSLSGAEKSCNPFE
ncbi:MAG: hypothetical protein ACFB0C_24685 [Leptolyngbyaceae cyanobacterium]